MRSILVPVADHAHTDAVFQAALMLARRFDSYVEGLAIGPDLSGLAGFEIPMGGPMPDETMWRDLAEQAREQFETFMSAHLPRTAAPRTGAFAWSAQKLVGDLSLGSYGRVFDIIVLGRPGSAPNAPRMATFEAALFESGRPVLVVPQRIGQTLGDNVVIAWNGSTETARTVALAMPLLKKAQRITVLSVEGGMVPGPSGAQLAQSLTTGGLSVEHKHVTDRHRSAGEVILSTAGSLGADFLVKGAYTQSRLRQMIFGGQTRHILAEANLPVLLAC
ncbi:MAG TPA: universal stress protein [Beijerinckiaceae bacterium]|jgi:nucleotide-binding universal stress UspA family protein|nr:universal stress protein [Beijerinckiaceae bacterium]